MLPAGPLERSELSRRRRRLPDLLELNVIVFVTDLADRVRREIVLARFIGKMAVEQGVREARRQLDEVVTALQPVVSSPVPTTPTVPTVPDGAAPAPGAGEDTAAVTQNGLVPDADELALADYDQLPSAHIVAMLEGLDDDERDAVERYETAGRHRRTILGKLQRLRSDDG